MGRQDMLVDAANKQHKHKHNTKTGLAGSKPLGPKKKTKAAKRRSQSRPGSFFLFSTFSVRLQGIHLDMRRSSLLFFSFSNFSTIFFFFFLFFFCLSLLRKRRSALALIKTCSHTRLVISIVYQDTQLYFPSYLILAITSHSPQFRLAQSRWLLLAKIPPSAARSTKI